MQFPMAYGIAGALAAAAQEGDEGPSYAELVLADGPIAYWRLGEESGSTAVDETDNHDGTYRDGTLGKPALIAGTDDTALGLAGGDVDTGIPSDELPSQFTVDLWFKSDNGAGVGDDHVAERLFTAMATTDPESAYAIGLNDGAIALFYRSDGSANVAEASSQIEADKAYHAALTYDGTAYRVYLSAEEVISVTEDLPGLADFNAHIGTDGSDSNNRPFHGVVDEVALYDRALTAREIRRHYWRGLGYTGYALEVLASGPVAYWRMGSETGPVPDEVGSNDLQGNNGPTFEEPGALVGDSDKSVGFDGTSSYCNTSSAVGFSAFSAEVWFKTDNNDTDGPVLCDEDRDQMDVYINSSGELRFHGFDGGSAVVNINAGTVNDDAWHFAAMTYDGSVVKAYLDGSFIGETSTSDISGTNVLLTGRGGGSIDDNYLHGWVDEIAVFDRALSEQEITDHYNAGISA